jgi:hypothetical protein
MHPQSTNVDRVLAWFGTRSHGVVTRSELLGAGVSPGAIRGRLRKGALWREYPGIYRVGHRAPSAEAKYLAAVRACGEGAVLSGVAAGWLWRLRKGEPPAAEVTSARRSRLEGLATRCCRSLKPHERTELRGIPVTTVQRTLIDLAGVLGEDDLARACHEAEALYRARPSDIRPNAPGAAKLRRVLEGDAAVTLSGLERGFLRLLRDAGLPLPETNRRIDGRYVDCRWPDRRLTVELDSYRFHNSRHSWRQDHQRERKARERGDDHRRYIWEDVFADSESTAAELRGLLR